MRADLVPPPPIRGQYRPDWPIRGQCSESCLRLIKLWWQTFLGVISRERAERGAGPGPGDNMPRSLNCKMLNIFLFFQLKIPIFLKIFNFLATCSPCFGQSELTQQDTKLLMLGSADAWLTLSGPDASHHHQGLASISKFISASKESVTDNNSDRQRGGLKSWIFTKLFPQTYERNTNNKS